MTGDKLKKRDLPEQVGKQAGEFALQSVWDVLLKGSDFVPGGGTVVAAAKMVLQIRDEYLVRKFLTDLADMMGQSSAMEARDYIAKHVVEPWAQEGVARALRAILDGVDNCAARCIAALAADYFCRQTEPDISHKRIANVLVDSDARILSALRTLLEAYPTNPAQDWYLALIVGTVDPWIGHTWFASRGNRNRPPEVTALLSMQLSQEIAAFLVSHGFATIFGGFSGSTFGNESACIPQSMGPTVVLLRECLRVADIPLNEVVDT